MLSLVAAGCAEVRKATYPPDFVYLTRDDVSNRMHRIAGHMGSLQALLDQLSQGADPTRIATMMSPHVDGMRSIATELGTDASGTNHLLLDSHLGEFVATLDGVRIALTGMPPQFHEAGQLVGSCNACHRFR